MRSLIALLFVSLVAAPSFAQGAGRTPVAVGIVEAIVGTEVILAGGVVRVDVGAAEFGPGQSFESLKVGDRLHMILAGTTPPLSALRANIANLPQVEVSGPIDAVGESSVRVFGVDFEATEETTFGRPATRPPVLADFKAGEIVQVAAFVVNGRLVVQRMTLVTDPIPMPRPPRPEATLEGTITAKGSPIWIVDGKRVAVTPRATILGNPQIGDRVRVTGWPTLNELVALTVTKL